MQDIQDYHIWNRTLLQAEGVVRFYFILRRGGKHCLLVRGVLVELRCEWCIMIRLWQIRYALCYEGVYARD